MMNTPPSQYGLLVAGSVVILTGPMLQTALKSVLLAERTRKLNGLPASAAHRALAETLSQAMSAARQCDVAEPEPLKNYPQQQPTIPTEDAARMLGLSKRQTQRLAPKLGGKIIAGRWLLDEEAIREHAEGKEEQAF